MATVMLTVIVKIFVQTGSQVRPNNRRKLLSEKTVATEVFNEKGTSTNLNKLFPNLTLGPLGDSPMFCRSPF